MSDCSCGIPDDAILMNVLHIAEYMDSAGEIYKVDLSHDSSGEELLLGKAMELCEWARAIHTAPLIADLVHDFVFGDDDGDEDETAEVP